MSYANMDHAAWVQRSIAAAKSQKPSKRELRSAREHKGWHAAPDELTSFQRRAFNILGIVGGGIYNAPIAWDALMWWPNFIIAPWHKSLATWDFQELTRLVLLCHDARIRGEIQPCGPRHLRICLHERAAAGNVCQRHPSMAEAMTFHRHEIGEQHPICFHHAETPA